MVKLCGSMANLKAVDGRNASFCRSVSTQQDSLCNQPCGADSPLILPSLKDPYRVVVSRQSFDLQESRLKAQDAVREDEGKWVEQERKLMERRVRHQVQVVPCSHLVCCSLPNSSFDFHGERAPKP